MGQVLHGGAGATKAVRRAVRRESREPEDAGPVPRGQPRDRRPGPKPAGSTVLLRASRHRGLSPACAVAAGPLPVRPPGRDSTADPVLLAPLLASAAASRGCRTWTAAGPRASSSRLTRSAASTSTSPRVRAEQGRLHLFAAVDRTSVDRTSKLALIQPREKPPAARPAACFAPPSRPFPARSIRCSPLRPQAEQAEGPRIGKPNRRGRSSA